jgi:hypothetical protein
MPARSRLAVVAGFTLVAFGFGACATRKSAEGPRILEVDSAAVSGCTDLGKIFGNNGWEGLSSVPGLEPARKQALGEAEKLKATHVVWDKESRSVAQSVTGRAYRCGDPPQPAGPTPAAPKPPAGPPTATPTPVPLPG